MGIPIVSEAVNIFLSNPLFAWFSVLFILIGDSFVTGLFSENASGVFGYIITSVFNAIGIPFVISSFELFFICFIIPIVIFVVRKSGK